MTRDHDPYESLRIPAYRRLLAGGVIASMGLEVQAVASGWEIFGRTRSYADLGYAGLVQFLPVLLFALPAGQAADRWNRRKLFQLALGLSFLASIGLVFWSWFQGDVWIAFSLLFISGVARALGMPSRAALLPQIVPLELLPNAVAWNSSGWQVANVVGPGIGGLVLAVTDMPLVAYLISAAAACTCILLLAPIQVPAHASNSTQRTLASLLQGLRFVFRTQLLLAALTLDLFAVLLGGATALLPVYAKEILVVGPQGLGALRAAPALGAVVMALVIAHRPPLQRTGQALLLSVAGFGIVTIVFGISESFLLSFGMLTLLGAFDNISVVVRGTVMQTLTPDEMRGRVAAVNSVFISSSNELGAFESGIVAAWLGPVRSVVFGGIGTLAVVVAAIVRWPILLRLGPLDQLHTLRETENASCSPLPSGEGLGVREETPPRGPM
ncbi:MAG: MFS transporter [Gemmataceae bacterium]|nr:MFS transporter [Gemmataceae bacterium]